MFHGLAGEEQAAAGVLEFRSRIGVEGPVFEHCACEDELVDPLPQLAWQVEQALGGLYESHDVTLSKGLRSLTLFKFLDDSVKE